MYKINQCIKKITTKKSYFNSLVTPWCFKVMSSVPVVYGAKSCRIALWPINNFSTHIFLSNRFLFRTRSSGLCRSSSSHFQQTSNPTPPHTVQTLWYLTTLSIENLRPMSYWSNASHISVSFAVTPPTDYIVSYATNKSHII